MGTSEDYTSSPDKALPPPPVPTTSDVPIVAALEVILGRLTLIDKRIPVLQDAAKPLSYTDAFCPPFPTHQAPSKKFLPSRILNKVTLQHLAEPALT